MSSYFPPVRPALRPCSLGAVLGEDPYYLSHALLVLDADRGVLKSGGTAASYLDAIPTWENQAASEPSYLRLPGIAANYASVPDAADLDGFTDFTLEAKGVTFADWTPSAVQGLMSKYKTSGNQRSWRWELNTEGKLSIALSFNGTAYGTYISTVATGVTDGVTADLMAMRNGSFIRFYVNGVKLGSDVPIATTALHNSTDVAVIGAGYNTDANPMLGSIQRARVWNSVVSDKANPTETPVLDANFTLANKGATSFTATSGQTVTIHSTAINTPAAIQRASGSDARQVSATLQGKLLTPSANNLPVGHLPGVASNYFGIPDAVDLDGFTNFTLEAKGVTLPDWTPAAAPGLICKYRTSPAQRSFLFRAHTDGTLTLTISFNGSANTTYYSTAATGLAAGATADLMVMRDGTVIRFYVNGVQLGADKTGVATTALKNSTEPLSIGMGYNTTGYPMLGSMTRARVWNSAVDAPTDPAETPVLDVNFEVDATHGDSSFVCTSGQTVTVHTSGDNPAAVIGYPVVRTDGSDDFMAGTFGSTLTGGRMFLVASKLGAGGDSYGRLFSASKDAGESGTTIEGLLWSSNSGGNLVTQYNSGVILNHSSGFSGRFLHEVDAQLGALESRVNNADEKTSSTDISGMESNKFTIAALAHAPTVSNAALDIEFLGLYPVSMTDADAAALVATLNARFEIF